MTPAELAKARAVADFQSQVDQAAEAAQAALAKARRAPVTPVANPAPDFPAPRAGSLSPAARQRAYLIAMSAGNVLAAAGVDMDMVAANDPNLESEAAKFLLMLQDDKRKLKALQAQSRKIELKRQLVPNYRDWCDGVLAGGRGERGPLDAIFTTIMMWTIDIGDFMTALPMAEHVLRYGLEMPAHVQRKPAVFIVEQIAEAAIMAYDLGGDDAKAFPHAVLPMLEDLIAAEDADMPDEVSAKLQKAIGKAVMAGADLENEEDVRQRQEATLRRYLAAMKLDPRVGVKGDVTRLKKALGKAEEEPTQPDAGDAVAALGAAIEAAANESTPPSPEGAG
nr:phage terminase small subunit [uncultured Brevundimonas sp.]